MTIDAWCTLPIGSLPGPVPPSSGTSRLIHADQAANLAGGVKVSGGRVFSNHAVTIGNDALVNGDVTAGADVQIGDGARVDGDVTAAGIVTRNPNGGSVIVGETNDGATVTPVPIPHRQYLNLSFGVCTAVEVEAG